MKEEKTYILESILDLNELVTEDNVDDLIKDLSLWLRFRAKAKLDIDFNKHITNLHQFRWIDDGKNEFYTTLRKKEEFGKGTLY